MSNTIIICTKDELDAMFMNGEASDEDCVLSLNNLFEFLCEHYNVDPNWQPNDVY